MKKILVAAVLVLVASSAFALGIADTKHNLIAKVGGTDQVCKYCHVPHNANSAYPLWARTGGNMTVSTVYGSSSMVTKGVTPTTVLGAQSLACLSCHTSVANIQAGPAGTGAIDGTVMTSNLQINAAGNLADDHPIAFSYTDAVTKDSGLNSGTATNVGGLPLYGTSSNMECATCHAVHGIAKDATNMVGMFLRTTNSQSKLCLKCHKK